MMRRVGPPAIQAGRLSAERAPLFGEPGLLAKHGAGLAALAAGLAALPGVGLPFLSDDWALLGALRKGLQLRTPFAYVRPLSTAWLRLDLMGFGMSPALVHLSSALLMGLTAAVLVRLLRRLTGDARLAAVAGLMFALHPHHIENAAWIAARPDVLSALLGMLALWSLDRWLDRGYGPPMAALLLFEAALLAKESVATLPIAALVLGFARAGGRPPVGRVLRGAVTLTVVAIMHFLVLWPRLAGRSAIATMASPVRVMAGRLADFVSAAWLAAPTDVIEAHPRLWFAAAILLAGLMVLGARSGAWRVPVVAGVAAVVFVIAVVPALLSFQARYLYLPGIAASVAMAALLLALAPRWRAAVVIVGGIAWAVAGLDAWRSYHAAGQASRVFVEETVAAARATPADRGLFIVNVPHRVRGAPVFPDLAAVVTLGTGRTMTVGYSALIDYPGPDAPGLDRSAGEPVRVSAEGVAIDLVAPPGMRSGLVWPLSQDQATPPLVVRGPGRYTARVPVTEAPVESIWYWSEGHLHRVAEPR
jgi:hypothetical protein